jgi:hypothetical protein
MPVSSFGSAEEIDRRGCADGLDGRPTLSATNTSFHTATLEHLVPGPPAEMSAVAYNLEYTRPLVTALVEQNPHDRTVTEVVPLHDRELVRVDISGRHPEDPNRRVCVIGISDEDDRARQAAVGAWFDYHASVLFARTLGEAGSFKLSIDYRVPGVPAPGAETVGVACDVEYLRPLVETAVARNLPTHDECHVAESGKLMLMRVDLYGRDPMDSNRHVCVGGIADRHYRAMAAAEQAWAAYHASRLFAAGALA